jgi:polysaccharide biosynthesis protein PslH
VSDPPASERLRVLFLAPFPPRHDAPHGGGRVVAQLIDAVAERCDVGLLYLQGEHEPAVDGRLRERCSVAVAIPGPRVPWSLRGRVLRRLRLIRALLRGTPGWVVDTSVPAFDEAYHELLRTWKPDVVQLEFSVLGAHAAAARAAGVPVVLDQHEPRAKARSALPAMRGILQRPLLRLDARAWRTFEREVADQASTIVVFTEEDRAAMVELGTTASTVTIPIATTVPSKALSASGSGPPTLVFVGNFMHEPNEDAALRLCKRIFPRIRAELPGAHLRIVGANVPTGLNALGRDGISFTGFVPDVTPFLDEAAAVVVPLRLGGGMRVKVLEALSLGKAVVASPVALAGIEITPGRHVLVAETDEEFVDASLNLLRDPELRAELARAARAWAVDHFDWQRGAARYEELYRDLARRSAG